MPKLLLLPEQTAPADEAFTRRHAPRSVERDYTVFRECLRWEFGFTCSICLLHERDIMAYVGVEGWGVTQIEHLVPRSHDSSLVGVYTNVIYVCRFCNGARSDADREDDQGRRLLDPTKDIWAAHFRVEEDALVPFEGDVHAAYTADVYAVNDARKVKLRRVRRQRTNDLTALIDSQRQALAQLTRPAGLRDATVDHDNAHATSRIHDDLARLYRLSAGGAWVPDDAPRTCRCGRADARSLPPSYRRQVVEIEVP